MNTPDSESTQDKANRLLEPLSVNCVLVDNEDSLSEMADKILSETSVYGKSLNVDFEGVNLCRAGKVCLGQFHISGSSTVYVVDFIAFDPISSANGKLKQILESKSIQKIFFDPRNDADALENLHNVHMNNVLCLQVSEAAYRIFNLQLKVRFVVGLQKAMDRYLLEFAPSKKAALIEIKAKGKPIFCPEHGGSYQAFVDRPLAFELLAYSSVDVCFMDDLKRILFDSLPNMTKKKVIDLSDKRLLEHKNPGYDSKGKEKAICPNF